MHPPHSGLTASCHFLKFLLAQISGFSQGVLQMGVERRGTSQGGADTSDPPRMHVYRWMCHGHIIHFTQILSTHLG